jgi:Fic family protein
MYSPQRLPPKVDLETKKVLKKLSNAHRFLAELKGISATIPNEIILLNTLILQEAKDSSAVENIITTHDELFKAELQLGGIHTIAAKEVQNYVNALKKGFELVRKNELLTVNYILQIQQVLEQNSAGIRKLPGTSLKNLNTGEVVYTPPQNYEIIIDLMSNLEQYINDDSDDDPDVLIKMAVIHFQFESIHPFYDGNGRTGRIINILYLVLKKLLDLPILYLSRYVIQNKGSYYKLLQNVRDDNDWESWIVFILEGVEKIAQETIVLIQKIKLLMQKYKQEIRTNYKFYSQDLLNNLFKHPYTKIEFLSSDLKISRITASKYLNELVKGGLLEKKKIGTDNYFINQPLFQLFLRNPQN